MALRNSDCSSSPQSHNDLANRKRTMKLRRMEVSQQAMRKIDRAPCSIFHSRNALSAHKQLCVVWWNRSTLLARRYVQSNGLSFNYWVTKEAMVAASYQYIKTTKSFLRNQERSDWLIDLCRTSPESVPPSRWTAHVYLESELLNQGWGTCTVTGRMTCAAPLF